MINKNFIFQSIWKIQKGFYKRNKGNTLLLSDYSERMIAQVNLANKFNYKKLIVIGDSNGENLSTYSNMLQLGNGLNSIGVNIAIGGTRADSWAHFFNHEIDGMLLYNDIKFFDYIIFNIGGNHILQDKMDILYESLNKLKEMFPNSYNCLVPPIHYNIISTLSSKDEFDLRFKVSKANRMIKEIWQNRVIDTYSVFTDEKENPYLLTHEDAVHFSDTTDRKIRIPLIIDTIKKNEIRL